MTAYRQDLSNTEVINYFNDCENAYKDAKNDSSYNTTDSDYKTFVRSAIAFYGFHVKKAKKDNKSDIYKLVLWTIYNMSVDLSPIIKESFKYSFFPSVGKVLELYETIRHTKKNNILYFNHEFMKELKNWRKFI